MFPTKHLFCCHSTGWIVCQTRFLSVFFFFFYAISHVQVIQMFLVRLTDSQYRGPRTYLIKAGVKQMGKIGLRPVPASPGLPWNIALVHQKMPAVRSLSRWRDLLWPGSACCETGFLSCILHWTAGPPGGRLALPKLDVQILCICVAYCMTVLLWSYMWYEKGIILFFERSALKVC